jgi:hypothetical protein
LAFHNPLQVCSLTNKTWHSSSAVHVSHVPAGVQFDQNNLAVKLGSIQLMEAGQPLAFDAKAASTYLKETCAKHGTVNIYVSVGQGSGKGAYVTHAERSKATCTGLQ